MTRTPEQVAQATSKSYSFNLGEYISQGFSIIGKNPGLFIGFAFVYLLIMLVCQIIPFLGAIVSPCLVAGFYLAANKQEQGKSLEFGDFFKGFDYIGQLLLVAVIQAGLMIVLMIPIGIMMFMSISMMSGDETPFMMIGFVFLLMLPAVYLFISWGFAPFLIIFHKMEAWPAMEASRKIVSSNWFMFFLFSIVTSFITMLGFLALGFGILYTMPAAMCMYYAAFRDIVGLPESHTGGTLMDHLVD